MLEQAGFPVSGLLVTHADWDHLLGRIAFPQASLGCGESTAKRLAAEPGDAQRELREFDEEQYIDDRGPLALAGDPIATGSRAPGARSRTIASSSSTRRTATPQTAPRSSIPWLGVLVCGDYLSPVEIPWISPGGSVDAYLATLERLRALIGARRDDRPRTRPPARARTRPPGSSTRTSRISSALRADGLEAPLPPGRRTDAQRRIHVENAQRPSTLRPT